MRGGITGAFDNADPDFVTDMTRHGFNNDWSIKTRKPIPDQRFSFSYGHSFRLGNGADLAAERSAQLQLCHPDLLEYGKLPLRGL